MADELMIIDDWVDTLTMDAHMIVFCRALRALDVPYTLKEDSEEPEFDHDALPDHALVNEAMNLEYRKMHAAELTARLHVLGKIKPDSVDENGEITWVPAD